MFSDLSLFSTAIFYCLELGNIAKIRKIELTHVVGTLEGLGYLNPNGVVVSFGVSLVLSKAVVEMLLWHLCQSAELDLKYHISRVKQHLEKMPQSTCILSIPAIIYFFKRKTIIFRSYLS